MYPSWTANVSRQDGCRPLLKQMAMLKALCLKFIGEVKTLDIEVTEEDVAEATGDDALPKGNALHQLRRNIMVSKVGCVPCQCNPKLSRGTTGIAYGMDSCQQANLSIMFNARDHIHKKSSL
eukprot:scaffold105252_cov16-Prasinocladus_malaysianus.AAC.1